MKSLASASFNPTRTRSSIKTIAALLAAVFIFDVIAAPLARANEADNFWKSRRKTTEVAALPSAMLINQLPNIGSALTGAANSNFRGRSIPALLDPIARVVPNNAAQIRETFVPALPSNASPVIIVQDVHMNSEAQLNIAATLSAFMGTRQVAVVGVEGVSEKFNFSPMFAFRNSEARKTLARAYLDKNMMAAPSFAALSSQSNDLPAFVGIDDAVHYKANVDAYLSSMRNKSTVAAVLVQQRAQLERDIAKGLSPSLREIIALRNAHRVNQLGLGDYVSRLISKSESVDLVIEQFAQAYRLERAMDFAKVDSQRRALIEKLAASLSAEETKSLVDASIGFRSGSVSFGDYYAYLKSVCEKHGVALSRTPEFERYVQYVLLSDGIKVDALLAAIERLEKDLISQRVTNAQEREIVSRDENIYLSQRLVNFELTPTEWERYKESELRSSDLARSAAMKNFARFYEEADLRSVSMVRNVNAALQGTGSYAVIVVGGFHTPEIAALLKKQNVPYAVIQPKLTKVSDDGNAYLSVFAREKAPLDRLFAGEKLFLAPIDGAVGTQASPNTPRFVADQAADAALHDEAISALTGAKAQRNGNVVRVTIANGNAPIVITKTSAQAAGDFSMPKQTVLRMVFGKFFSFLWAVLTLSAVRRWWNQRTFERSGTRTKKKVEIGLEPLEDRVPNAADVNSVNLTPAAENPKILVADITLPVQQVTETDLLSISLGGFAGRDPKQTVHIEEIVDLDGPGPLPAVVDGVVDVPATEFHPNSPVTVRLPDSGVPSPKTSFVMTVSLRNNSNGTSKAADLNIESGAIDAVLETLTGNVDQNGKHIYELEAPGQENPTAQQSEGLVVLPSATRLVKPVSNGPIPITNALRGARATPVSTIGPRSADSGSPRTVQRLSTPRVGVTSNQREGGEEKATPDSPEQPIVAEATPRRTLDGPLGEIPDNPEPVIPPLAKLDLPDVERADEMPVVTPTQPKPSDPSQPSDPAVVAQNPVPPAPEAPADLRLRIDTKRLVAIFAIFAALFRPFLMSIRKHDVIPNKQDPAADENAGTTKPQRTSWDKVKGAVLRMTLAAFIGGLLITLAILIASFFSLKTVDETTDDNSAVVMALAQQEPTTLPRAPPALRDDAVVKTAQVASAPAAPQIGLRELVAGKNLASSYKLTAQDQVRLDRLKASLPKYGLAQGLPQMNIGDPAFKGVVHLFEIHARVQYLLAQGDVDSAEKLILWMVGKDARGKFNWPHRSGGLATIYNIETKAVVEENVKFGPMLYFSKAALDTWEKSGRRNPALFAVARDAFDYVLTHMDKDGGARQEPTLYVYTPEYQLNISLVAEHLYGLTGDEHYKRASELAEKFLFEGGAFHAPMFDAKTQRFQAFDYNTQSMGEPADVPALAALIYGPERLKARGVDLIEQVKHLAEIPNVGLPPEWIAYRIYALRIYAEYFKTMGDIAALNQTNAFEAGLTAEAMKLPTENDGYAYAYIRNADGRWIPYHDMVLKWTGAKTPKQGSSFIASLTLWQVLNGQMPISPWTVNGQFGTSKDRVPAPLAAQDRYFGRGLHEVSWLVDETTRNYSAAYDLKRSALSLLDLQTQLIVSNEAGRVVAALAAPGVQQKYVTKAETDRIRFNSDNGLYYLWNSDLKKWESGYVAFKVQLDPDSVERALREVKWNEDGTVGTFPRGTDSWNLHAYRRLEKVVSGYDKDGRPVYSYMVWTIGTSPSTTIFETRMYMLETNELGLRVLLSPYAGLAQDGKVLTPQATFGVFQLLTQIGGGAIRVPLITTNSRGSALANLPHFIPRKWPGGIPDADIRSVGESFVKRIERSAQRLANDPVSQRELRIAQAFANAYLGVNNDALPKDEFTELDLEYRTRELKMWAEYEAEKNPARKAVLGDAWERFTQSRAWTVDNKSIVMFAGYPEAYRQNLMALLAQAETERPGTIPAPSQDGRLQKRPILPANDTFEVEQSLFPVPDNQGISWKLIQDNPRALPYILGRNRRGETVYEIRWGVRDQLKVRIGKNAARGVETQMPGWPTVRVEGAENLQISPDIYLEGDAHVTVMHYGNDKNLERGRMGDDEYALRGTRIQMSNLSSTLEAMKRQRQPHRRSSVDPNAVYQMGQETPVTIQDANGQTVSIVRQPSWIQPRVQGVRRSNPNGSTTLEDRHVLNPATGRMDAGRTRLVDGGFVRSESTLLSVDRFTGDQVSRDTDFEARWGLFPSAVERVLQQVLGNKAYQTVDTTREADHIAIQRVSKDKNLVVQFDATRARRLKVWGAIEDVDVPLRDNAPANYRADVQLDKNGRPEKIVLQRYLEDGTNRFFQETYVRAPENARDIYGNLTGPMRFESRISGIVKNGKLMPALEERVYFENQNKNQVPRLLRDGAEKAKRVSSAAKDGEVGRVVYEIKDGKKAAVVAWLNLGPANGVTKLVEGIQSRQRVREIWPGAVRVTDHLFDRRGVDTDQMQGKSRIKPTVTTFNVGSNIWQSSANTLFEAPPIGFYRAGEDLTAPRSTVAIPVQTSVVRPAEMPGTAFYPDGDESLRLKVVDVEPASGTGTSSLGSVDYYDGLGRSHAQRQSNGIIERLTYNLQLPVSGFRSVAAQPIAVPFTDLNRTDFLAFFVRGENGNNANIDLNNITVEFTDPQTKKTAVFRPNSLNPHAIGLWHPLYSDPIVQKSADGKLTRMTNVFPLNGKDALWPVGNNPHSVVIPAPYLRTWLKASGIAENASLVYRVRGPEGMEMTPIQRLQDPENSKVWKVDQKEQARLFPLGKVNDRIVSRPPQVIDNGNGVVTVFKGQDSRSRVEVYDHNKLVAVIFWLQNGTEFERVSVRMVDDTLASHFVVASYDQAAFGGQLAALQTIIQFDEGRVSIKTGYPTIIGMLAPKDENTVEEHPILSPPNLVAKPDSTFEKVSQNFVTASLGSLSDDLIPVLNQFKEFRHSQSNIVSAVTPKNLTARVKELAESSFFVPPSYKDRPLVAPAPVSPSATAVVDMKTWAKQVVDSIDSREQKIPERFRTYLPVTHPGTWRESIVDAESAGRIALGLIEAGNLEHAKGMLRFISRVTDDGTGPVLSGYRADLGVAQQFVEEWAAPGLAIPRPAPTAIWASVALEIAKKTGNANDWVLASRLSQRVLQFMPDNDYITSNRPAAETALLLMKHIVNSRRVPSESLDAAVEGKISTLLEQAEAALNSGTPFETVKNNFSLSFEVALREHSDARTYMRLLDMLRIIRDAHARTYATPVNATAICNATIAQLQALMEFAEDRKSVEELLKIGVGVSEYLPRELIQYLAMGVVLRPEPDSFNIETALTAKKLLSSMAEALKGSTLPDEAQLLREVILAENNLDAWFSTQVLAIMHKSDGLSPMQVRQRPPTEGMSRSGMMQSTGLSSIGNLDEGLQNLGDIRELYLPNLTPSLETCLAAAEYALLLDSSDVNKRLVRSWLQYYYKLYAGQKHDAQGNLVLSGLDFAPETVARYEGPLFGSRNMATFARLSAAVGFEEGRNFALQSLKNFTDPQTGLLYEALGPTDWSTVNTYRGMDTGDGHIVLPRVNTPAPAVSYSSTLELIRSDSPEEPSQIDSDKLLEAREKVGALPVNVLDNAWSSSWIRTALAANAALTVLLMFVGVNRTKKITPLPIRLVRDAVLLPLILAPAVVSIYGFGSVGWTFAAVWMFVALQLIVTEVWLLLYRSYRREKLVLWRNKKGAELLYDDAFREKVAERYRKRVLGTYHIKRRGVETTAIGQSVPREFAPVKNVKTGEQATNLGEHTGSAESLFLISVKYIHLYLSVAYQRSHPNLTDEQLSEIISAAKAPTMDAANAMDPALDDPELMRLDRWARRQGEWFRNQLDRSDAAGDAFAKAALFYMHKAEAIRDILNRAVVDPQRSAAQLERDRLEINEVMSELGIVKLYQNGNDQGEIDPTTSLAPVPSQVFENGKFVNPDNVGEAEITERISKFAEDYNLVVRSPYWQVVIRHTPRIVIALVGFAFFYAWRIGSLSPLDLIAANFFQIQSLATPLMQTHVIPIMLAVGAISLLLSLLFYWDGNVMKRNRGFSKLMNTSPGRLLISVGLMVGMVGTFLIVPGIFTPYFSLDLVSLLIPLVTMVLLGLEIWTISRARMSFLGSVLRYHFGPAAMFGSVRGFLMYVLQYLGFISMAWWMGSESASYFEGYLVSASHFVPHFGWGDLIGIIVISVTIVAFLAQPMSLKPKGLANTPKERGAWAKAVRFVGATILVAVVLTLLHYYRPLGGFVIGGLTFMSALILVNASIYNWIIGFTSVARETGRPRVLAEIAIPMLMLGMVNGDTQAMLSPLLDWFGIPLPAALITSGAVLRFIHFFVLFCQLMLAMSAGHPAFAIAIFGSAIGWQAVPGWAGAPYMGQLFFVLVGMAIVSRIVGALMTRAHYKNVLRTDTSKISRNAFHVFATGGNPTSSPAIARVEKASDALDFWKKNKIDLVHPGSGAVASAEELADAIAFLGERETAMGVRLDETEAIAVRGQTLSAYQEKLKSVESEPGKTISALFEVDSEVDANRLRLALKVIAYAARETAFQNYIKFYRNVLRDNAAPANELILGPTGRRLSEAQLEKALRALFTAENAHGRSIFSDEQIVVQGRPLSPIQERLADARDEQGRSQNFIFTASSQEEADLLIQGWRFRRYLVTMGSLGGSQIDTVVYLTQYAKSLRASGVVVGDAVDQPITMIIQKNKYSSGKGGAVPAAHVKNPGDPNSQNAFSSFVKPNQQVEMDERIAWAQFIEITTGIHVDVTFNHSYDGMKSAAQNGDNGTAREMKRLLVFDRNAQSFDMMESVLDTLRMLYELDLKDPNAKVSPDDLVKVVQGLFPQRSTPNIIFPVGSLSDLGEFGYSMAKMSGIQNWQEGDPTAIGWGMMLSLFHDDLEKAFGDPNFPYKFGQKSRLDRAFGAVHGFLNLPHVSEDHVQLQWMWTMALSLGVEPRMEVSTAFYYKLRETYKTAELPAARERWAAGGEPGQKGSDILDRIMRFHGNDSVFMKENQGNRASFYTLRILGMISILVNPILVWSGYTPFAGILLLLYLVGVGANQDLTLNGLASYVRRMGFWAGLSVWITQRLRDMILFAPNTFIEFYGVMNALMKGIYYPPVFNVSGGGGMDQPGFNSWPKYLAKDESAHLFRWMFMTGAVGTIFNLYAITQLDLMNVFMLYPSLVFTLGLAFGTILYQNEKGPKAPVLSWARLWPRLLGMAIGIAALGLIAIGTGELLVDQFILSSWMIKFLHSWGLTFNAHILLPIGSFVLTMLFPARSYLIPVKGDAAKEPTRESTHNLYMVGFWLVVSAIIFSAIATTAGPLIAVLVIFAPATKALLMLLGYTNSTQSLPFRILIGLLMPWRPVKSVLAHWNEAKQIAGPGAKDAKSPLRVMLRLQLARSAHNKDIPYWESVFHQTAMLTIGLLMWFILVPTPVLAQGKLLAYSLTLDYSQVLSFFMQLILYVGVVFMLGFTTYVFRREANRARFVILFAKAEKLRQSGKLSPGVSAIVESAIQGVWVTANTKAPFLADKYLKDLKRALKRPQSAAAYYGRNRSFQSYSLSTLALYSVSMQTDVFPAWAATVFAALTLAVGVVYVAGVWRAQNRANARAQFLLAATDNIVKNLKVENIKAIDQTGTFEGDLSQAFEEGLGATEGVTPTDIHSMRLTYAAALHRDVMGEDSADTDFAGSLNAFYADAMASRKVQVVTRFISSEDQINKALAARNYARQEHGAKLVRHVFTVPNDEMRLRIIADRSNNVLKDIRAGRLMILTQKEASNLDQLILMLTSESVPGRGSFLSDIESKNAEFRFLIPDGMDISAFVGTADLDPLRFRFFMLISDALNAFAVEVSATRLSDLPALYQRIASQA